jgi:hypothetical protein
VQQLKPSWHEHLNCSTTHAKFCCGTTLHPHRNYLWKLMCVSGSQILQLYFFSSSVESTKDTKSFSGIVFLQYSSRSPQRISRGAFSLPGAIQTLLAFCWKSSLPVSARTKTWLTPWMPEQRPPLTGVLNGWLCLE